MSKSQYRQLMLSSRTSSIELNTTVNEKLIKLLTNYQAKNIAGYLAIKQEVDILPTLNHFCSKGANIYLPSIIAKQQALAFKPWNTNSELVSCLYGTLEVAQKATCSLEEIKKLDFMLIPCVGVFKQKSSIFRIGYGGGFYDRTISEIKKINQNLKTVGIFHQNTIPTSEKINIQADIFDMPLDILITPNAIL